MTLKKWEELDVLDNYLINAVASDPDVAEPFFRRLLSVLLQRKVGKIRVAAEKFFSGIGSGPARNTLRCGSGRVYVGWKGGACDH